jgi:hypothetical protein
MQPPRKLVNRTMYDAPKADNAQRRTAVEGAGWVLYERGPYYAHEDYPGFYFSLAAAYQVARAEPLRR